MVEGEAMGRLYKGLGHVVPAAVLTAEAEAAQVRARAEEDATALRAETERAGFEAGKQAGLAQVSALLLAARAQAERDLASAKDAAIVLARRMAERIVGRAVELSPELMGEIVAEALVASRARKGTVVLRAHPDDLAVVERERPHWLAGVAAGLDVRVVADPAVGRHGCVVDTAVGRVDARLDAQLDALERALRGVAASASS
jgi:flagellar biosynthesis/type III secretory pathway protein FliH